MRLEARGPGAFDTLGPASFETALRASSG